MRAVQNRQEVLGTSDGFKAKLVEARLMVQQKLRGACLVVTVVASLSACSSSSGVAPTPTPLPPVVSYEKALYTVERGPIVDELKVDGRVVPSRQDLLFFYAEGYVTRVSVQEGGTAEAGELLAELQIDDLLSELEQAQIDLNVARTELSDEEEARRQEMAQAQHRVRRAQIELELFRTRHAHDLLTAKTDVERAEQTLADTEEEYQKALNRTWEPQEVRDGWAEAVASARTDYQLAQSNYGLILKEGETELVMLDELAMAELELAQLEERGITPLEQAVERAELSVERLEAQVAERRIIAPYDCVVLERRIRPGDRVDAFDRAFVVGDPTEVLIRTSRHQERIDEMRENTQAFVYLSSEATEGHEVKLVTGFSPFGSDIAEGEAPGRDWVYFTTPTTLGPDELPVGKLVDLIIVLGRSDDALLLHPASIRSFRGYDFVIVQEGDRRRRVEVQIELESPERVQVIGDLREGDQVVGP
jgi:multidrug efflux pump subunit AcrA (membrane-fusion protein)